MRYAATLLAFILARSAAVPVPGDAVASDFPVEGSRQLVLVVTETDSTPRARLTSYERSGGNWVRAFSCPAVVGKNGMGWGRGLHRDRDRNPAEPVKREGDGKAPMGAFKLLRAYGYPPRDSVRTRFPYRQTTPDLACIDDARSEHYAMIVNAAREFAPGASLPTHEDMFRSDDLYRYIILIGHNTTRPVPGAGSCIFLHVWRGEDSSTAGCTAIAEENMVRLLEWLDPVRKPVIVQFTRKEYERLRGRWGLPGCIGE